MDFLEPPFFLPGLAPPTLATDFLAGCFSAFGAMMPGIRYRNATKCIGPAHRCTWLSKQVFTMCAFRVSGRRDSLFHIPKIGQCYSMRQTNITAGVVTAKAAITDA